MKRNIIDTGKKHVRCPHCNKKLLINIISTNNDGNHIKSWQVKCPNCSFYDSIKIFETLSEKIETIDDLLSFTKIKMKYRKNVADFWKARK